jgi:hypothetical protein
MAPLKHLILFSSILCIGTGSLRSQNRSEQDLRAFREKQILDAYQEKMHLPEPGAVESKNEESELPLSLSNGVVSKSSPESEVHAAVNPTNDSNIVVCPIHLSPATGMQLPIYYTKNFGGSWIKSTYTPLPYETGASVSGGGDPVFAYDADGKVYMTWIDTYSTNLTSDSAGWIIDSSLSGTYWASSTNGGQTWVRPASPNGYVGRAFTKYAFLIDSINFTIKSEHIDTNAGFNDKQWMACDRSNSKYHNSLYVAWTYLGIKSTNIVCRRKLPGVDSMLPAVKVTPDDLLVVQFSSLGVDAQGGLHITFMGSYNDSDFGIYTAYSSDGGATFQPIVKISNADIPGKSADAIANGTTIFGVRPPGNYPCPHLSIDTLGTGDLFEVWNADGIDADGQNGTDIYFSRSTDNGVTWSTPSIVNNDRDTLSNYTDHFYPSIAVDGKGMISVTWYDRREDPNNQIGRYYIGHSTDQGKTWSNAPVATLPMDFNNVFKVNSNFGIGEYTQVLATPDYTIPIWTDGRDNAGGLKIYAAFLPSASSGVNRLSTVTEGLELSDNYPNPFGSATNLSFTLGTPAHAELYVTNIAGQRIANLFNGVAEAGQHDLMFDGSRLPNGVYYLNLESDLGIVRRAMTILH